MTEKFENGTICFNKVHNKERVTPEEYFVNAANHNRSEGGKNMGKQQTISLVGCCST